MTSNKDLSAQGQLLLMKTSAVNELRTAPVEVSFPNQKFFQAAYEADFL